MLPSLRLIIGLVFPTRKRNAIDTYRRHRRSLERTIRNDGGRETAAALGLLLPGLGDGVPRGGRLGLGGHSAPEILIGLTGAARVAAVAVAAHGSHPTAVADDDLGG